MAFIETSLEKLPLSANLGQSCLATKISAPGPSSFGWFHHRIQIVLTVFGEEKMRETTKEKEKNQTSPKERKPSPVANLAQPLFSAQPAKRSGPTPFFFSLLPRGPIQRQQPSIIARVTPLHSSSRSGSAAFVPVRLTSGPRLSAPPSRKPRARRLSLPTGPHLSDRYFCGARSPPPR